MGNYTEVESQGGTSDKATTGRGCGTVGGSWRVSSARSPGVGMRILLRDSCESSWGEWLCHLVLRKGERQPWGALLAKLRGVAFRGEL